MVHLSWTSPMMCPGYITVCPRVHCVIRALALKYPHGTGQASHKHNREFSLGGLGYMSLNYFPFILGFKVEEMKFPFYYSILDCVSLFLIVIVMYSTSIVFFYISPQLSLSADSHCDISALMPGHAEADQTPVTFQPPRYQIPGRGPIARLANAVVYLLWSLLLIPADYAVFHMHVCALYTSVTHAGFVVSEPRWVAWPGA